MGSATVHILTWLQNAWLVSIHTLLEKVFTVEFLVVLALTALLFHFSLSTEPACRFIAPCTAFAAWHCPHTTKLLYACISSLSNHVTSYSYIAFPPAICTGIPIPPAAAPAERFLTTP